jgi:DeoR/GlpR family transcriptional regulator of sugar metabolism
MSTLASCCSRPLALRSTPGLTYPSFADLQLKQAMIGAASRVYLVADSTKINRSSFARLGTLDVIHSFITDDGIRDDDARAFESRGIEVIIASRREAGSFRRFALQAQPSSPLS